MLEIISLVLMEMSFICKEFLLLLSRSPPGMRRLSLYNIFIIALIRGKVKPFLLYNNKERKGQSQRLSTPWLWFDDAKE
jgi:hypothetical protein